MLCWSREFPKYFWVILGIFEVGDENFGVEIGGRNFGSEVWIEPIPAIFDVQQTPKMFNTAPIMDWCNTTLLYYFMDFYTFTISANFFDCEDLKTGAGYSGF